VGLKKKRKETQLPLVNKREVANVNNCSIRQKAKLGPKSGGKKSKKVERGGKRDFVMALARFRRSCLLLR